MVTRKRMCVHFVSAVLAFWMFSTNAYLGAAGCNLFGKNLFEPHCSEKHMTTHFWSTDHAHAHAHLEALSAFSMPTFTSTLKPWVPPSHLAHLLLQASPYLLSNKNVSVPFSFACLDLQRINSKLSGFTEVLFHPPCYLHDLETTIYSATGYNITNKECM